MIAYRFDHPNHSPSELCDILEQLFSSEKTPGVLYDFVTTNNKCILLIDNNKVISQDIVGHVDFWFSSLKFNSIQKVIM